MSTSAVALAELKRTIPYSHPVFPVRSWDRFKYLFWRVYTPLHPYIRDTFLRLGIMVHEGRTQYLIGHLAPGVTIKEFVEHCVGVGYGNHFIAWREQGELIGLRYVVGFEYQYHVRIFEDGEVRGHYEYTPECYPWWHIKNIGQEDRRHVLLDHLGAVIVPVAV
jgi:hypothetical protein